MHISRIIVGGSSRKRYKYSQSIAHKLTYSDNDIHHIEGSGTSGSISIGQVKSLIASLFLSPISGTVKIGIISELQKATPEAQNALLKLLEEPDDQTILIATAKRESMVLPTIVSRCQIITLSTTYETKDDRIHSIISGSDGDKLTIAEELSKDKDYASSSLQNWIYALRSDILNRLKSDQPIRIQNIRRIRMLERALSTLKYTNTNHRLLLENLLLEL